MKKYLSILLAMVMVISCLTLSTAAARIEVDEAAIDPEALTYAYWDTSLSDEERAADLISHMTLEEKASQLGSHPAAAIPRLGVAEYWYPGENLNGIANISLWYGNEAGDAESAATSFPSTLSQGSTWNEELIGRMADAIGDEARAFYNTSLKGLSHWGPSVNLARDPRWGRTGDSFGEDVILSGKLGSAFVKGFQGALDDSTDYLKALACIKHFAANNAEAVRSNGSSNMSESELREFYLRHFEIMVEESDPESVMAAYNAINGLPCHANYDLLNNILEKTWGFSGWVVSDNTGVENLNNQYGVNGNNAQQVLSSGLTTGQDAVDESQLSDTSLFPVLDGSVENGLTNPVVNDMTDAVVTAITAGVDLDLRANRPAWGMQNEYQARLVDAVNEGKVAEAVLDEALLDLFTSRMATGEFDRVDVYTEGYQSVAEFIYQHQDLALEVAEQSIVMLENNGILPAKIGDFENVIVVGQYVEELLYSDYKSNQDWRVANGVDITFSKGIEDAVAAYNAENGTNVKVRTISLVESEETGLVSFPDDGQGGQAYNALLTNSKNLIIYVPATRIVLLSGGADAGEGNDRDNLLLPRGQDVIAQTLCEACDNLVIAIHAQSIVDTACMKGADAILWASYLGEKQGVALADVVFGKVSPSGRLTTTWYADETQLGDVQHDYTIVPTEDGSYGRTYMYFTGDKTYSFGYGLSYASFAYDGFAASAQEADGNATVTFTVNVKNTSDVDAYEVVELYAVGPNAAALNRADKVLAGFAKVLVPAGETVPVAIDVKLFNLSVWDETAQCFTLETGDYRFYLGADCDHPVEGCEADLKVTTDAVPAFKNATLTPARMILAAGETVETEVSVSLTNDKLFAAKADIPADVALTYASSNEAVATVDAATGAVTAVGAGVCTITVTAAQGEDSITASHAVAVK
ncbi:MAG: glycoside hydrolase family 3 C-terminal domain-containing protein [Clostridia bacterium]|nr:glycoside hydrolase family 3 C-terminal domain-containing protein [Clostridia bacterium]